MEKSLPPSRKSALTKESIIGLGEASFRKNHYPALQKKIADLELLNSKYRTLIETIPDVLLVTEMDEPSEFSVLSGSQQPFVYELMQSRTALSFLKEAVEASRAERHLVTRNLSIDLNEGLVHLEVRVNITETEDALIIIRDVTQEVNAQIELRELAHRDGLTRLNNRRHFEDALSGYNGTHCNELTIILMDIDGLKIINDTLGHLAGDQILISISGILRTVFREAECVARVGGDEFGVLLRGRSRKEIDIILSRLDYESRHYENEQLPLGLSVSYGYAYLKDGMADTNLMFREADNKMYQNKLLKENSNRNSIVKTLMKTLEVKDFITQGHADRLGKLAVMIGKELSLPQDIVDRLDLLAKFHDIGKVGIPDSILMKPGRLSESEWEIMKSHSSSGKRIAEASPGLKEIAQLILLHHEKWDGTGYPLGLKGESIPLECRILGILDAFDAMTSDRPYRKAMPVQNAIEEIKRCAGTQFDESLVEVFVTIIPAGAN